MRHGPPAWPRHDVLPAVGLALAAVRHELPAAVREHSHDFAELALVVAGEGIHRSAAGERRIGAGDLAILPPRAWHAYRSGRGLAVFDVGIGDEVLRHELAWLARDRELGALGRALAGGNGLVVGLAPAVATRVRSGLDRLAAETGIARLAHLLLAFAAIAPALPAPTALPPAVTEAARLMQDEPAARWTLAGLARRLGRDRSHFARDFRAAIGLPPMAWLARLRADRAAELLSSGDDPVAAIGAAVGWHDPVHFSRRFRSLHGCAPGAWRRR